MRAALFLAATLVIFVYANAAPVNDEITHLPGFSGTVPFKQYSGYVTVNATSGKNLFYWLALTDTPSATTPLVLWMNGGPGCSSLFGLLTEHGPFRMRSDNVTLELNPYRWNQVANMLYLESPAGVGFSYALNGNYTTGDDDVAANNYNFLKGFFQLYPELKSLPFYIAGESYAGHYVPQLANLVSLGNQHEAAGINMKGFMAGNPSFDWSIEGNFYYEFMAKHGFVSAEEYAAMQSLCAGQYNPPPNPDCAALLTDIHKHFVFLDPYNIYAPCVGDGPDPTGGCLTNRFLLGMPFSQTFIPCIDTGPQERWLNSAAVKQALHVSTHSMQWVACSPILNYNQYAATVLPIYQRLVNEIRIQVYSGDCDSCVPYLGTQQCVMKVGLPSDETWRAWLVVDEAGFTQTAGFTTSYGKGQLKYATVKGAGHMVPTDRPREALALFTRFLNDQPL